MTEIYERDLYGMKYAILKSPYHKRVVTACADMLGITPMQMRRIFIENLDMLMLESLGARFDSWKMQGDQTGGIRHEIGYDLFTKYIPIIPEKIMKEIIESVEADNNSLDKAREQLMKITGKETES